MGELRLKAVSPRLQLAEVSITDGDNWFGGIR